MTDTIELLLEVEPDGAVAGKRITLLRGDLVDTAVDGQLHIALHAPWNTNLGADKIWVRSKPFRIIMKVRKTKEELIILK